MGNPNGNTVLYSPPIIVGRKKGSYQYNGMGSLVTVNISERPIKINHEIRGVDGAILADGYSTIEPGRIDTTNALIGGAELRDKMYCKLWYEGSNKEIIASFIMSTVEGPPGDETHSPVYSVSLRDLGDSTHAGTLGAPQNLAIKE